MKHEIFIIAVLHLTSMAKTLPSPKSADSSKLQESFEPRDLTYDLSFGWFGTNEDEGVLNPGIKIASQIREDSKTETVQSLLRALEEESKHADSEQQKKILNLIQDFNKILVDASERYCKTALPMRMMTRHYLRELGPLRKNDAKPDNLCAYFGQFLKQIQVLLNNVWHTIDMGVFGSTQRIRTTMSAEKFIDRLKKLILQILELFYDYFTQDLSGKSPGRRPSVDQNGSEMDSSETDRGSRGDSSSEHGSGSDSHGPTSGSGIETGSKEYSKSDSGSGVDSKMDGSQHVQSDSGSGPGSGKSSGLGSGTGNAPSKDSPESVASGESGSDSAEMAEMDHMGGEMTESSGERSSTHGPSSVETDSSTASSESLSSGESSMSESSSSDGFSRRESLDGRTMVPKSGETEMQSSEESFSEGYDANKDMMKGTGNTNRPCPSQVKLTP